jgi:hypothetical protein
MQEVYGLIAFWFGYRLVKGILQFTRGVTAPLVFQQRRAATAEFSPLLQ